MGQPTESRPGKKQPMTPDSLLADGAIESLANSGRVVGVLERSGGAWAVVPPEGTQIGDKITHGMGVGIGDQGHVTFESLDGVKRGVAELVDITLDQVALVKVRVASAVKGLKK